MTDDERSGTVVPTPTTVEAARQLVGREVRGERPAAAHEVARLGETVTYRGVVAAVVDMGGLPCLQLDDTWTHALTDDTTLELLDGPARTPAHAHDAPGDVSPTYYEVTVRLPLDRYDERWFDAVADAAGPWAAVSGTVVPAPDPAAAG